MRSARLVILALALGLALGCRTSPSPPPPSSPADARAAAGSAVIEVHADVAGVKALALGHVVGVSPRGLQQFRKGTNAAVDALPARVECPLHTACMVTLRGAQPRSGVVFAFDPTLSVELDAPREGMLADVRYRDPATTSAILARVHAAAEALAAACAAEDREAEAAADAELRRLRAEPEVLVRDAARLAWLSSQCADAAERIAVATAVLDELDDGSPVVGLWPQGVARAGALLPERGTADLLRIADAQPDRDVAGAVLVVAHALAFERGDEVAERELAAQLETERYAGTIARSVLRRLGDKSRRFLVDVGEPLPRLTGTRVGTGEPIDTDAMRGRPILVYLTSISCGGCTRTLPALRTFAAEHPEVHVLVVVLDEAPGSAQRLADEHAPVPGVLVDGDVGVRAAVTESLMNPYAFPSFVFADAEGTVRATSLALTLPELHERLTTTGPAAEPRTP